MAEQKKDLAEELDVECKSKNPQVVHVLGGPCCGKNTQCKMLVEKYPKVFGHVTVRDVHKQERKRFNSRNANVIDDCLKNKKQVPIELTVFLLQKAVDRCQREGKKVVLMEGFPKNHVEYDAWFKATSSSVDVKFCLFLDVLHDQVIKDRFMKMAWPKDSLDTQEAVLAEKIKVYHNFHMLVIEAFESDHTVKKVDAEGWEDDVFKRVEALFQKK